MRRVSFISTAGHGYLVIYGDTMRALMCATGYDYQSEDGVVYLEEDLSAVLYVKNFMTAHEQNGVEWSHRDKLPRGLTRITEAGSIGRKAIR